MKPMKCWKRAGILLLAVLLGLMLLFTGCAAEDVDLALDIADAVINAALEESETAAPAQEDSTPESSQAPPTVETEPEVKLPPAAETPEATTPPAAPSKQPESEVTPAETPVEEVPQKEELSEDGRYTSVEDVALYIHTYGKLPKNFITKNKARDLGWDSKAGNLWEVTDQMSIGGDRFGNYEGLLPEKKGRTWKECDVNYEGGYRGSERILFSNDGLIFYTNDHYKTFTQLY